MIPSKNFPGDRQEIFPRLPSCSDKFLQKFHQKTHSGVLVFLWIFPREFQQHFLRKYLWDFFKSIQKLLQYYFLWISIESFSRDLSDFSRFSRYCRISLGTPLTYIVQFHQTFFKNFHLVFLQEFLHSFLRFLHDLPWDTFKMPSHIGEFIKKILQRFFK